jgi:protein TonB
MNRALKFTIWHGMAASLALHSALALPFVVHNLAPPPDDAEVLVVELQGMVSDTQAEEKVVKRAPDPPPPQQQPQPAPPPPQEAPPPEPQEDDGARPPEPQPQVSSPQQQPVPPPQARQVQDPDEQQKAQILKVERDLEADRLRKYVKRLTKKVQAHLVYPNEGRKGNATVSFTLTPDGQVKPGTLAIAVSSGQPKLDASALQTIRACAPFHPPPEQLNVAIVVDFKRRH